MRWKKQSAGFTESDTGYRISKAFPFGRDKPPRYVAWSAVEAVKGRKYGSRRLIDACDSAQDAAELCEMDFAIPGA